jgi:hypothetical protein
MEKTEPMPDLENFLWQVIGEFANEFSSLPKEKLFEVLDPTFRWLLDVSATHLVN